MKLNKWLPIKLIGTFVYLLFSILYLRDGENFLVVCCLFIATLCLCSIFRFFDVIWRYL